MAEILVVDPLRPEPDRIARAAGAIRRGEVVAIPTDTLYGLAADPYQTSAVERVFAIKGRATNSPLLLLVDSIDMAVNCSVSLPTSFHELAGQFWPGPLTLVVPAAPAIPALVTAGTGYVGLRWPASTIAVALIRAVGGPITGTSANLSGQAGCLSAAEVESALGTRLPLIVDGGPSTSTQPSTVLRVEPDRIVVLREGAIPRSLLSHFLKSMP